MYKLSLFSVALLLLVVIIGGPTALYADNKPVHKVSVQRELVPEPFRYKALSQKANGVYAVNKDNADAKNSNETEALKNSGASISETSESIESGKPITSPSISQALSATVIRMLIALGAVLVLIYFLAYLARKALGLESTLIRNTQNNIKVTQRLKLTQKHEVITMRYRPSEEHHAHNADGDDPEGYDYEILLALSPTGLVPITTLKSQTVLPLLRQEIEQKQGSYPELLTSFKKGFGKLLGKNNEN